MLLKKVVSALLSLSLLVGVAGIQVYAEASDESAKVDQTSSATNSEQDVTTITYQDYDVIPAEGLSNNYLSEDQLAESKVAGLAAGVYFIPGIGEVALLVTGGVVIAGATYYAGSVVYNKVKAYLSSKDAADAEIAAEAAYKEAKKNGTKTGTHEDKYPPFNNLLTKGKPRSSEDLYDSKGLKQRRYYDSNGNADEDIDYDHSNADGSHTFPHRHKWINGVRSK
ncbi:hypothetical protein HNR77_001456 [Paenibacillus sp. JGP012]|uniref:hypothetical protein n=1 Tax=Paenibacillus sp. JGP012 TaxID=2735914 RepID=UPI0016133B17|nr:hypothetical protein [Paenibacillus sp. JGP012]MBB6020395.1 hypothetical protein [Paenibacillus sp. JGP012]